jgi:hypothetical protein
VIPVPVDVKTLTLAFSGVSSYFPSSLPRRLTRLLSNASLATALISSLTYYLGGAGPDGEVEDPHGILAMPTSGSVTHLTLPPAPGHTAHSPANLADRTCASSSKSATLSTSLHLASQNGRAQFPTHILTRHTPFTALKFTPPCVASVHKGKDG